jgi:hypothetical protein
VSRQNLLAGCWLEKVHYLWKRSKSL